MSVIKASDSDIQTLLAENPNTVVKFYADWCGSCKLIAPKYNRLSEEIRFSEVAFLEVNAEQSPEIRKAAGVSNLPFFATFKNGELVKADATSKVENIAAMVEAIL